MRWTKYPATDICAECHAWGPYVISVRPNGRGGLSCEVSHRPLAEHHHVGSYTSLAAAKSAAKAHDADIGGHVEIRLTPAEVRALLLVHRSEGVGAPIALADEIAKYRRQVTTLHGRGLVRPWDGTPYWVLTPLGRRATCVNGRGVGYVQKREPEREPKLGYMQGRGAS